MIAANATDVTLRTAVVRDEDRVLSECGQAAARAAYHARWPLAGADDYQLADWCEGAEAAASVAPLRAPMVKNTPTVRSPGI